MAKKNESLGEKALRYGKAYLFRGGAWGVGKEVADDIEGYREQALYDEYLSPMDDAWESKDYEQVIEIADAIINEDDIDEDIVRVATWRKAGGCFYYALQRAVPNVDFQDERNKQTLDLFKESLGYFYDYGSQYGWDDKVMYWIMLIHDILEEVVDARDCAICLLNSEDRTIRTKALEVYKNNTNTLLENSGAFTEAVDYSKRKYVFLGKDIQKIGGTYQWSDDDRVIDWIFTLDQVPSDMVFPYGRQQSGLYMAHPVLTDRYYPMETAEEKLFMEKVIEFCWLVQCLGATEVSFHSNKGLSVSQGMESSRTIKADVGVKKVGVGGEYGNTHKYDEDNALGQKVELVQRFTPKEQAYCPDDLVWLDSDPQWKMLVKQRLEGGIMEFNYKISSSETCQMSSNETNAVKANFEYMMVKVNGSYDSSLDQTFSHSEETEWSIHVEFAPLEELKEQKQNNNSKTNKMDNYEKMDGGMSLNEQERKEYSARINKPFSMEIKDIWELEKYPEIPLALGRVWSGVIEKGDKVLVVDDSRELKATVFDVGMFNKLLGYAEAGDACGIMLQGVDAGEIQVGSIIYKASEYSNAEGQNEITDAEKEYLDSIRECLEDGEIGMRERKLLDKIRVKNGISEERAKELEATLCTPQLTDDEKEYLEAFRDACEDGKVSDKQRRLLEKLRVMYGISEERASQLEKIYR